MFESVEHSVFTLRILISRLKLTETFWTINATDRNLTSTVFTVWSARTSYEFWIKPIQEIRDINWKGQSFYNFHWILLAWVMPHWRLYNWRHNTCSVRLILGLFNESIWISWLMLLRIRPKYDEQEIGISQGETTTKCIVLQCISWMIHGENIQIRLQCSKSTQNSSLSYLPPKKFRSLQELIYLTASIAAGALCELHGQTIITWNISSTLRP